MNNLELLTPTELEDELDSEIYRSLDPYWRIEVLSLKAMSSTFGISSVRAKIEQVMPTPLAPRKLADSIREVKAIRSSEMMKWCGDHAAREAKIVHEVMQDMIEGSRSCVKFMTGEWLASCATKMGGFCMWTPSVFIGKATGTGKKESKDQVEGKAVSKFSAEAAVQYLVELEEKVVSRVADQVDIDYLKCFAWLLSDEEFVRFDAASSEVNEKTTVAAAGVQTLHAASTAPACKQKKGDSVSGGAIGAPVAASAGSSMKYFT